MILQPVPRSLAQIEPLEARIAPATLFNPLPDLVAGSGKTGATIDLSEMFDADPEDTPHRTIVELTTNVDMDPATPGLQAGKIVIELYDDEAPLSVQNFLAYVNNTVAKGDYDNTIIHRSVPGFVIQGGGFEASSPFKHIPTFPTVHNEPDVVNRSNLRGTLAMAKVGGDPNSATSEWFVNLADNSGNLDNQNGGFTVFGEVISGMELVDAIAGLSTANLGGALGSLPVQGGYDADPDDNPNTPSPTPKLDQFVRIVEAKVRPSPGESPNVSFRVESVVVPETSTTSDLLTASVTGQTLNLKYTPGKSGFADVTVVGIENGVEVRDTFRVDVRPNLIIDITSDSLQGVIVAGDSGTIKLNLTNNGAAAAIGTADILIGLIKMNPVRNAQGQITGFEVDGSADPITLTTLENVALNLAGGKSASFTTKVQIPTVGLAPEDTPTEYEGTAYQLIAQVTPKGGDIATAERYADDNVEQLGRQHHAMNRFGTFSSDLAAFGFGGRTNATLTYLDNSGTDDDLTDDTLVTWSMKGPGLGRLSLVEGGGVMVETDATTVKSTLNASVAKSGTHISIASAQLYATLGTANLGSVDLQDYLFAPGGVKTLTLGDVTGPATMLLGSFPPDNATKATLKFGRVQDLQLESSMPIASFTAIEWLDTVGTNKDYLQTLGLGTLKITGTTGVRGDFEADLTLTDSAPISALSIAGFLSNSTIQTFGDIGTVTLGGMKQSALFAGVSARPEDVGDFGDALSIKSFTIKGVKGSTDGLFFIDSQVAASTLGTVKVTGVATVSGDSDFGFVADVIKSYNRVGIKTAKNVTLPNPSVDEEDNYVVQVL